MFSTQSSFPSELGSINLKIKLHSPPQPVCNAIHDRVSSMTFELLALPEHTEYSSIEPRSPQLWGVGVVVVGVGGGE